MTTKGTVDNIAQRYLVVCEERDELRAEVERLKSGRHTINVAGTSPETAYLVTVPCAYAAQIAALQALVDAQAEDDALWLLEPRVAEAYLQQELRKLHAAIEGA